MKKVISTLMLCAVVPLIFSGCAKKTDELTAGATDSQTAMAIYSAFGTVFSQLQYTPTDNPAGNINQTINGTGGGNVVVTGTATMDQGSQHVNWNITLNWNNFKVSNGSDDYTLGGAMTYSGYAAANAAEAHFSAPSLTINGTIGGTSIAGSISFGFDVSISGGHGTISGNINGRSFSSSF